MKKRIGLIVIAMVTALAMVACGKKEEANVVLPDEQEKVVGETVVVAEQEEEVEVTDEVQDVSVDEDNGEPEEVEEVADGNDGEVSESEETESENDDLQDVLDPKFKAAMDSYEDFFDEYVDFMKKYMDAGPEDMVTMMGDYSEYLAQYAETMKKLDALEGEDMTAAEAAYYAEVTGRITQKLLEVQ